MLASNVKIPLNVVSYGEEEIAEVVDSLRSGYVTMGKKVKAFEQAWAQYVGVKHAIMTNSGSSANLIALSALKALRGWKDGDEVITPALTWATTVFPIAQVGLTPVLADVDLDTYNLSPIAVREALSPRTRAIMPVHLLGHPCHMTELLYLAQEHEFAILEDSCEAHGAEILGQRVGSFGNAATFSFFFSHHISTIEGGMVVTSNDELANLCRSIRAFGWVRDMADKEAIARENPEIDPRFLFAYPGFNVRPTEMQGAIGMHQVPRLEGYIAIRRENAAYWNSQLAKYGDWLALQEERPLTRHTWFAYPVRVKKGAPFTAKELMAYLESRGVECRPIEAGAMNLQPAMKHINWRQAGSLANAENIHHNAFFWGNHHCIGPAEREAVVSYINEFMGRF